MLEDNLLYIKKRLVGRTRDKKELKKEYVAIRLTKSLQSYRKDMERRLKYLSYKKPGNILKRF